MGNSFGCSASGERLVSAARDGDLAEARALLAFNPLLAKYSTFGALNSPLHFAAAKGHVEIVSLLLQNGADVNIRNYCGQTALMQACRFGHWEIVQTLLLYKANVGRADYLNRRTAFHFAAVNGHVRCLRLLVSDYIPSVPFESDNSLRSGENSHEKFQLDKIALSKLVSKAADGGITALHLAALYGHFDCVQLLLDLLANVSAITFHYGTAIDLIGAGSTPLHYAACGGSLHCCQVLIARGASRTVLNCNGWLPWDVARVWGRHWLESLLAPNTQAPLPSFPTSRFWSLPLMSILNIARDLGLEDGDVASEEISDHCAVCLERKCTVAAEGCGHELCTKCALYLCSTSNSYTEASGPPGSLPCPMCRHGIISFVRLEKSVNLKDVQACSIGLCTSCRAETCEESNISGNTSRARRNRVSPISVDSFRAVSCTGFSGLNLPLCTCSETLRGRPVDCNNDSALGSNVSDDESSSTLSNAPDEEGNMNLDSSPVCQFSVTPWKCKLACN